MKRHQKIALFWVPVMLRKHVRFQKYMGVQFINVGGNWVQYAAINLSVLGVHHSVWNLFGSIALSSLTSLCIVPYAGKMADRFQRRTILIVTVSIRILGAMTYALLQYLDAMHLGFLYTLGVILSLVGGISSPAASAMVPEMVPKALLQNATHTEGMIANLACVFGIPIGVFLLGPEMRLWLFLINMGSYVPALLFFIHMEYGRTKNLRSNGENGKPRTKKVYMRDALRHIQNTPKLRRHLFLSAGLTLCCTNGDLMQPFIGTELLGGETGYRMLVLSNALGGLLVGYSQSRRDTLPTFRRLVIWGFVFTLGGALYGASPSLLRSASQWIMVSVAMILLGVACFGAIIVKNSTRVLLLQDVEEEMVGRISAVYIFIGQICGLLSSLMAASVASLWGIRIAAFSGSTLGLLFLIIWLAAGRWSRKAKMSRP